MTVKKPENTIDIDFSNSFASAVYMGPLPSMELSAGPDYSKALRKRHRLLDRIADAFSESETGYELERDSESVLLLCSFPLDHKEDYAETFLRPLAEQLQDETGTELVAGIGIPAANRLRLREAKATAKDAFELFFFEEDTFFEYQKCRRRYDISFEDYEQYSDQAFKAILMKSPSAIDEIDSCVDLIRRIHYGNKQASIMRVMNFTGEMAYRLHRFNFLDGDFYHLQDALQEKVLSAVTFREVKQYIHEYYISLLSDIYRKSHTSRKTTVEQIKTFIRENYMEDLSVSELAALSCVSTGYFSHMFKEEAGVSCKAYLTEVRLKAAMELLLGSDYRLYEISDKVGYKNLRNFEEAFRKQYGSYPGDYKKQITR